MLYKKKVKQLFIYMILLIPFIYFADFLFLSSNKFSYNNSIVGVFSIPCCILCYKIKKESNLFLYMLAFLSIVLGNISHEFFLQNTTYQIDRLFWFREIIFLLILFPQNKISNYIITHKKFTVFISILINLLLMISEYFYVKKFTYTLSFFILFCSILIFSYTIICSLLLRSIHKKNFIETTYSLSIVFFSLRFFFPIFNLKNEILNLTLISNNLFFIGFSFILIGLYVEVTSLLNENDKLNKDVKVISKNIKEIKEVEKLRSNFFANISHEFKTPISVIFSSIQLLEKQFDNNSIYQKYNNIMKQNCYRMIRLTTNLVDLSKLESGYMDVHFANHDIISLVEEICTSVIPYLKKKNISLTFDTLVEEVEIQCDQAYIERIILNILSNSIKFSKENGNIFVFMDADDKFVTIKVKDDGIGIDIDKINHLFNPFIQEDKNLTRKKEGCGLGLSIIKALVQLHNGIVYFSPIISNGTEIIVKLPNIKLDESRLNSFTNINSTNILSKIAIEFSDIY